MGPKRGRSHLWVDGFDGNGRKLIERHGGLGRERREGKARGSGTRSERGLRRGEEGAKEKSLGSIHGEPPHGGRGGGRGKAFERLSTRPRKAALLQL